MRATVGMQSSVSPGPTRLKHFLKIATCLSCFFFICCGAYIPIYLRLSSLALVPRHVHHHVHHHVYQVQLEARTRELESLQAKLVPQDLDMLRSGLRFEHVVGILFVRHLQPPS